MTELQLTDDFRDILIALADAQAEFLLIGGWALAVHGHPRGTDDMDVFVRATPDNAARVYQALLAFGAPVKAHGVTEQLFAAERYGYRMGRKPNLIEVLTSISGVDFDTAYSQHETVTVDGRQIPVIGRDALLANKKAAGRAKDNADVDWLENH